MQSIRLQELASGDYRLDGEFEVAFYLQHSHDEACQCIGFGDSLYEFLEYLDERKRPFDPDQFTSDDHDIA